MLFHKYRPYCLDPEKCFPGCKPFESCLQADAGLFAEVRYFQVHELEIPDELNNRYLESLILQESTVTAQLKQDAFITRRNTQAEVNSIPLPLKYYEQNSSKNN